MPQADPPMPFVVLTVYCMFEVWKRCR